MSDIRSELCSCPPGGHDPFCKVHGIERDRDGIAAERRRLKTEKKRRDSRNASAREQTAYRDGRWHGIRAALIAVYGPLCWSCGRSYRPDQIECHHRSGRGMGGGRRRDTPEEAVLLCQDCHRAITEGWMECPNSPLE